MGSVIFMAGDERKVSKGAFLMIHNPWVRTAGEAKDLRHDADILDKMKNQMVSIYGPESKITSTVDELIELMDAETWLEPEEALELGFVTEITDREEEKDLVARSLWKDQGFSHTPSRAAAFFEKPKNSKKPIQKPKQKTNLLNNNPTEGAEPMDVKAYQEKHPDHYNSIVAESKKVAVNEERTRIQEIEALSKDFSSYSAAVKVAVRNHLDSIKYDGEQTVATAAKALLKIANETKATIKNNTAAQKAEEAGIAEGLGENASDNDGSGDNEAEKKAEDKATVSGMAAGIKNYR
jgi:hypothetical protein